MKWVKDEKPAVSCRFAARDQKIAAFRSSYRFCVHPRFLKRTHMKNDNLRADRDDLDDFIPRAPAKREKSLVLQVATGVFLGGLALWLVQLAATAAYAKLMLGTITFGS